MVTAVDLSVEARRAARGWTLHERLTFTREVSEKEWRQVGKYLTKRLARVNWALGDWLLYGGGRAAKADGSFPGRGEGRWTGSGYNHAMAITGLSKPHLSNCFRVAEAFPAGSEVSGASWTLHLEALRVEPNERRDMLVTAAAKRMTAATFRRALIEVGTPPEMYERAPATGDLHVQCPQCAAVFRARDHAVTDGAHADRT